MHGYYYKLVRCRSSIFCNRLKESWHWAKCPDTLKFNPFKGLVRYCIFVFFFCLEWSELIVYLIILHLKNSIKLNNS